MKTLRILLVPLAVMLAAWPAYAGTKPIAYMPDYNGTYWVHHVQVVTATVLPQTATVLLAV